MSHPLLPAPILPLLGADLVTRLGNVAEAFTRLVPRPDAPRVLILPGLPGTLLGHRRFPLDDIVWLDMEAIREGRLSELTVSSGATTIEPLDLVAPIYLQMQLALRRNGWDVDVFPFDWRLPLDHLGNLLHDRLREDGRPVHLVAHSYGGLVARAAIQAGADNVGRVIMLGTPNHGTFATVQGIRGNHWVLRLLDGIDQRHDISSLAAIFASYPSVYDQLPARSRLGALDLHRLDAWPKEGPQPQPGLLSRAPDVEARFAGARGDFVVIAGHGYPTITRVTADEAGLRYEGHTAGDGWVSADSAMLDGTPTYFVEAAHLGMPNHPRVIAAVLDLLGGPTTDRLSTDPPEGRPIPAETDAAPSPLPCRDLFEAFTQIFNVPEE